MPERELKNTILFVYGALLAYNGDRPDHLISVIKDEVVPVAKQILKGNNTNEHG